MLDVGKLATLRAVLAHGSFSAAAASLNLTQPAVSRQVSLLERQVGTQLVRRTQRGVLPTEAGQLLVEHAEAVLGRLALAEAQVADLAGLRSGHVRLGSFFTALVYLSAELAAVLEARHPDLFRLQNDVIEDQLVDRATAFRRLAAGELDVAIVFEHVFDPSPPPGDIELIQLFDDPPRALVPAAHALAQATSVAPADLADDTWIRAHRGSAADLVDHVLARARLTPPILHAGHGDEPIEAQAFIAAGRGVTVAHRLNVILDPAQIAAVPLQGAPVRHIQAAIMREQRAPAARAVVDALHEVGRRRVPQRTFASDGSRRSRTDPGNAALRRRPRLRRVAAPGRSRG
jgi:DNA-binding transcriptional LysR family regulator